MLSDENRKRSVLIKVTGTPAFTVLQCWSQTKLNREVVDLFSAYPSTFWYIIQALKDDILRRGAMLSSLEWSIEYLES